MTDADPAALLLPRAAPSTPVAHAVHSARAGPARSEGQPAPGTEAGLGDGAGSGTRTSLPRSPRAWRGGWCPTCPGAWSWLPGSRAWLAGRSTDRNGGPAAAQRVSRCSGN